MNTEEHTHPSYGIVQIHRVSGDTTLFRSSLQHHNFIEMKVSQARVLNQRDCAYDYTMENGPSIVEVRMSETQFARAITSLNMGSGAPCTISRVHGKRVAEAPINDRAEFIQDAHDERLKTHADKLKALHDKVSDWREAKHRPTLVEMDELIRELGTRAGNFVANSEYYRTRFKEDVEGIVDDAKTEIEAHITATAHRLGVEQLTDVPTLTNERLEHGKQN